MTSNCRADSHDILVSAHFVYAGRVGGAEQMLYNLLRGLRQNGSRYAVVCSAVGNLAPDFAAELARARCPVIEAGAGGPRFWAEQKACLDGRLRAHAILFPNYFTPPVLPARLGRVVTAIHDFQYRHFPENFTRRKRLWLRLAHAMTFRRADTVVAISEFVRRDAIDLYGAEAEAKTIVIPDPVSWDRFGAGEGDPPHDGRPYILSVAAHYPHKRLDVLVRAFAGLAPRHRDVRLVLAGQLPDKVIGVKAGVDVRALIAELGIADRVAVTGYVDDRELGRLYRHATVFAFPSVFEGFGMPPVEALGLGLPTITTRAASLPEITLGEAIYVERPGDPGEWAERLTAVLDDPAHHAVPEATARRLRETYAVARIGRLYARALGAPPEQAV